ncbi:hypothetical protein [uncultured Treponema sp.]|uniref:hypothetical protein n=1 Tax=uncultured Treponema sp. TaxID=162155 RepID=UPI0025FA0715|nr:hypothetical protein [uncultured Treponema sp.]
MVTFARNEIVSSSQFVRSFATFLQRMTKSNDEKIAVVKNNQMQAVLIPIDEYERLKTLDEMNEQKEIFQTVQARKNTPQSEYVSFNDAMKTAGL